MAGISHRFIETNGIKMHIAEQGSGPVVLLVHGFPEFWYSWRHQIPVLAQAGFHAVAPDMRGYGKTDAPVDVKKYTILHIIGDLIGLLDALGEQQVFVIGHDWGAYISWHLALLFPDRVKALVNLSVTFKPPSTRTSIQNLRTIVGDGFYIFRFQEPGRAEADFSRYDCKTLMKKILLFINPDPLIAPPDKEVSEIFEQPESIPHWISEEEIQFYADQFEKTGFVGGLNYYRVLDLNSELLAPWVGARVVVPALFIVGDKDTVYNNPGEKEFIHKGGLQACVPNLRDIIVHKGAHHFIQAEIPDVINGNILSFLKSFTS
eukprot:c27356_g1_i1 orf=367-1323(-)